MKITPEIGLYRGMIERAVIDSLAPPPKALPEYPPGQTSGTEYNRIRDERKSIRSDERERNDAKECLFGYYLAGLYKLCYGVPIDSLKDRLVGIWEKIEQDPSLSKKYISQFNKNTGRGREDDKA